MTKEQLIKLQNLANDDEKVKLRILYDAVIDTLKAYKSKYSQSNLKDWKAAEDALEQFAQNIQTRQTNIVEFDTIKEIVTYLKSKYPGAVQSTIYNHSKKGFLIKNDNGRYALDDVESYAAEYIKSYADIDRPDDKKADPRYRYDVARADKEEIKTRILLSDYIERETLDRALAERARIFKSDIENFIRSNASEMVHLVNGDDLKIPDIVEFWLNKSAIWLSRYSADIEHELPDKVDFKRLERAES